MEDLLTLTCTVARMAAWSVGGCWMTKLTFKLSLLTESSAVQCKQKMQSKASIAKQFVFYGRGLACSEGSAATE